MTGRRRFRGRPLGGLLVLMLGVVLGGCAGESALPGLHVEHADEGSSFAGVARSIEFGVQGRAGEFVAGVAVTDIGGPVTRVTRAELFPDGIRASYAPDCATTPVFARTLEGRYVLSVTEGRAQTYTGARTLYGLELPGTGDVCRIVVEVGGLDTAWLAASGRLADGRPLEIRLSSPMRLVVEADGGIEVPEDGRRINLALPLDQWFAGLVTGDLATSGDGRVHVDAVSNATAAATVALDVADSASLIAAP